MKKDTGKITLVKSLQRRVLELQAKYGISFFLAWDKVVEQYCRKVDQRGSNK